MKKPIPEDFGISEDRYYEISAGISDSLRLDTKKATKKKMFLFIAAGIIIGGVGVESQNYFTPLFGTLFFAMMAYSSEKETFRTLEMINRYFIPLRREIAGKDYEMFCRFEAAKEYYDTISELEEDEL